MLSSLSINKTIEKQKMKDALDQLSWQNETLNQKLFRAKGELMESRRMLDSNLTK